MKHTSFLYNVKILVYLTHLYIRRSVQEGTSGCTAIVIHTLSACGLHDARVALYNMHNMRGTVRQTNSTVCVYICTYVGGRITTTQRGTGHATWEAYSEILVKEIKGMPEERESWY